MAPIFMSEDIKGVHKLVSENESESERECECKFECECVWVCTCKYRRAYVYTCLLSNVCLHVSTLVRHVLFGLINYSRCISGQYHGRTEH